MGKYSDPNNPCANIRSTGTARTDMVPCGHYPGNHAWTKDESNREQCEVEDCGCPEYIDSNPKPARSAKPDIAAPSAKPDKTANSN